MPLCRTEIERGCVKSEDTDIAGLGVTCQASHYRERLRTIVSANIGDAISESCLE